MLALSLNGLCRQEVMMITLSFYRMIDAPCVVPRRGLFLEGGHPRSHVSHRCEHGDFCGAVIQTRRHTTGRGNDYFFLAFATFPCVAFSATGLAFEELAGAALVAVPSTLSVVVAVGSPLPSFVSALTVAAVSLTASFISLVKHEEVPRLC